MLGFVRMPDAELEAMLARAAEKGAKRARADVGLEGEEAAPAIRDLRSLRDCIRLVRRTALQTAVPMITIGVMLALLAGIACRGTGKRPINEPASDTLQALRDRLGKPLIVRKPQAQPCRRGAPPGPSTSKAPPLTSP